MKSYLSSLSFLFLIALNIFPPLFFYQIDFDNAPEIYLPEDQPSVILEKQLREIFPDDQVAIVLFKHKNLYGDAFLLKLEKTTREIKQIKNIDRVINVTEIEHISGTEDGFEVKALLGKDIRMSLPSSDKRFEFAKNDRIAHGLIVSKDEKFMAMIVRPFQLSSTIDRIKLMDSVYSKISDNQLDQYIAGVAGPIPLETEQFRSMIRDTMLFVPGTTIIGLVLIWFMFRRLLAVIVAGMVSGAVVNCTLLLLILFHIPYTLIASMIPPLLAALTTALLIHFFNNMQLASMYSYSGRKKVEFALDEIRKPAIFTALTTIIGLCSLGVSPIPPIKNFGLATSFGVMLLLLLVLYIVPHVFIKLDHDIWKKQAVKHSIIDQILQKILHFSIRNALSVVIVMVVMLAAGIPFILKVTAETNMLKFFEPEHSLTVGTDLIEQKLTGVMPLEIELYGDGRDSLKKAAVLRQIKTLKQWLIAQPEIDKVNSVVDIVEDMHRGFHQGKLEYLKIPDNDQLISQYFFIYDGNDVYELVNREFDHARVILSLNNHNSKDIRELIDRINQHIALNISNTIRWEIGGEARLFADQDELLIQGQLMSLFTAIIFIFSIMLILWKKISYAFLTMIPNLSPIIGIFILMGIFNIWLDMATAMIASVSIGIAVDDTIHLFHGYKKRTDKGISVIFALVQSYYKAGRAIVVTTFILCAQFLLLSFSQFVPTSHFGILTATGLLMALIFDLLLLPALIIVFHQKRVRSH